MPGVTPAVCGVLAACFVLGAANRRNWKTIGRNREKVRPWALGFGWALLAISVGGFVVALGWEVGLAWFAVWLGLAAVIATVWISVRPRSALWVGSLLIATAVSTAWIV